MSQQTSNEIELVEAVTPGWFWAVSAISLLWNLAGAAAFVAQMTMDSSLLPIAERAFYEAMPDWATAAFATAVVGGVLGSVALLLRRRWAFPLLVVSLLGILVQISHSLFVSDGIEIFGPAGLILPLLTFSIAVALVRFSRQSAVRGWLK